MYYIIETNYVGPNQDQDQYADADKIQISTSPAITNSSHEPRTDGWCGTTNDWAVHAHGEYATLEAARAAVTDIFGEVREVDMSISVDEDVVAEYRKGRHEPLGREATGDWAYEGIRSDITADTDDVEIDTLAIDYQVEANDQGFELDSDLRDMMIEYRDELRAERDDS